MPDDWKSHIRSLLAPLRLSPARESEIVEELAQHLEDRWRELVARGMTPEDAAHTARTEFDGARLEALLGTLRQAHWHELPPPGPSRAFSLDSLRIDLRHAIRALRATPSFTIGALIVLALGTGATTAIFSVADAVALRPLPFPEPDRIVAVGVRTGGPAAGGGGGPQRPGPGPIASGPQGPVPQGPRPLGAMPGAMPGAKPPDPDALMSVTPQDYLEWADQQQVFESMAAIIDNVDFVLQRPDAELEIVKGQRVTASFFDVLRAQPMLGTAFEARNEVAGSERVAVVSHRLWQRYFRGDPEVVGRTLMLNDESYTIAGVMPASFAYRPGSPQPADVWTPWVVGPRDRVRGGSEARALGGVQIIARLAPGVSLDQAQAQMTQVAATIAAANPTISKGRGIGVRPLRDHLVGTSTRLWMLMLLAAVGIVLLIACANVANLWLARASVQQRDAAVRAALGASRGRLVQRLLIESLVVSIAGTVAGLALAWFCVRVLSAALPESLARVAAIGIDARTLAVAGLAALMTGLVSGIAPALQASSPSLSTALNESTRSGGTSRGRRRARAVLVVAEVALAIVLLVGAALFIGSFINVMRIDPGLRTEGVLAAQLIQPPNPGAPPPDIRPALADIVDRARRLPGVIDAAAAAPGIPFRINLWIDALQMPGESLDVNMTVSAKIVTAGYHRTLAIPLRSGRYFTDDDREGAEAVVILSDAATRMFLSKWPSNDPLGRVVFVAGGERRIVGIVANARQASLEVSPHPEVYLPMAQGRSQSYGFVLLHTSGDPNDALPGLRTVAAQMLPQAPLRNVARLEDLLAAQTAERRLSMLMFSLFGLLGLVISAVGIFSVIAYLVSQQTRDIGIRMALGATRARVVAAVFGQVGRLVAAGLIVGSLAAWSLSNAAGRFLFGLDPRDARAYAIAMITLLAAAFIATLLPARRAASINPTDALRNE
jgi:putative ABC transport system permease protein